jgi:hypothetical protein
MSESAAPQHPDDPRDYEERLRRWSYAVRQLFQTPRAALIEAHAVELACRALNVGRVTAFVGSGASVAYGRISWNDLIYAVQTEVIERARALEKVPEIDRIRKLLEQHRTKRGAMTSAVQQLTIFQMAEELDEAIRAHAERHPNVTVAGRPFRRLIMWLTHDDRGHVELLLKDALFDRYLPGSAGDGGADFQSHSEITQLVEGVLWKGNRPDDLSDRRLPSFFLDGEPPDVDGSPPDDVRKSLALPAERYRFAAWLTERPWEAPHKFKEIFAKAEWSGDSSATQEGDQRRERRHFARADRDPLLDLLARLRITRFLTTNYDHEIESLFRVEGYQQVNEEAGRLAAAAPLAESFRDVDFTRETTGELAALVSRGRSRAGWVVHLHGRAQLRRHGDIIATEEDYRQRYARPDEARPLIDDAIRLTFGASPILFVGIGMNEMDLFRPLRQFMSTPTRLGDRVAVALLPKREGPAAAERQKIDLLQRYGVYTIHFGDAERRDGIDRVEVGRQDRHRRLPQFPWLEYINAIRNAFDAALAPFDEPQEFAETLQGDDFAWTRYRHVVLSQHHAVEAIRHKLRDNPLFATNKWLRLEAPTHVEGIRLDRAPALPAKAEIEEINAALVFLDRLARKVKAYDAGPLRPGRASRPVQRLNWWSRFRRQGQAHKVRLAGAVNALTTTALCARLLRLEEQWHDWRDEWQTLPVPRPARPRDLDAQDLTVPGGSRTIRLVLFQRHALNLHNSPTKVYEDPPTSGLSLRGHRFYAGAPSQTFNSLLDTLKLPNPAFTNRRGRRVALFIARRGIGKGHFFAALQQLTGPAETGRLAQVLGRIAPPGASEYYAAFFNLSFSLEVTSIFDRIAFFLFLALPDHGWKDHLTNWNDLRHNRTERLRFVLRLWADIAASVKDAPHKRRILLAFNAVNVLFDREGKPKNRQFRLLFEALLDPRFDVAPIDLIFVSTETGLPEYFRRKPRVSDEWPTSRPDQAMRLLMRPEIPDKDRAAELRAASDLRLAAYEGAGAWHIAHFLRPARASAVVNAFFPSVSLIIARHVLHRVGAGKGPLRIPVVRNPGTTPPSARLNVFELTAAKAIHMSLKALLVDHKGWPAKNLWDTLPLLMAAAAIGFETSGEASLLSLALRLAIAVHTPPNMSPEVRPLHGVDEPLKSLWIQAERFGIAGPPADVSHGAAAAGPDELRNKFGETLQSSDADARGALLTFLQHETGVEDVRAITDLADQIDAELKDFYTAVGGRRFTLTLLFATAYEIFNPAIRPQAPAGARPAMIDDAHLQRIKTAADNAMGFLVDVRKEIKGLRSMRRDDIVITRAMERLKQLHIVNSQRSETSWLTVEIADARDASRFSIKTGTELYELLEWMLWHFAVISVPIEADVLVRCPFVQGAIERILVDRTVVDRTVVDVDTYQEFAQGVVQRSIELLVTRCLVYRLRPSRDRQVPGGRRAEDGEDREEDFWAIHRHLQRQLAGDGSDPEWADKAEKRRDRFGIHRGLQRHIFHRMGAAFVEYAEVDRFSLTLFASQPNDIPRLTPESHAQLRKTVWALSGYPEGGEIGTAWDTPAGLSGDDPRRLRKRMLRAAYGIVRSIYSVASVARFDIHHERIDDALRGRGRSTATVTGDGGEQPPARGAANRPGFFEEHRQQILWLISQARDLGTEGEGFAPFYAEEIVWLYNEAAVLSLAQGRLPDAALLCELANRAAARLEPDEMGPLRTLIALNRSVVEIERGRIASARDTLDRIISTTANGIDPEAHAIATGYWGLIHHLTGHVDEALTAYKDAVAALTRLQKTRSASIFARHKGDLLRTLGKPHYAEAQAELELAIQLSRENSHEDTRHLALLAMARLKLGDPAPSASHSAELHAALDEVEGYARVMGMPRLTTEVHEIRARLHEQNGDFKTAGTVAMASLEIAALHELQIRKANVLTLLARINLKAGRGRAAQALLDEALDLIRNTGDDAASRTAQEVAHAIRAAGHLSA